MGEAHTPSRSGQHVINFNLHAVIEHRPEFIEKSQSTKLITQKNAIKEQKDSG